MHLRLLLCGTSRRFLLALSSVSRGCHTLNSMKTLSQMRGCFFAYRGKQERSPLSGGLPSSQYLAASCRSPDQLRQVFGNFWDTLISSRISVISCTADLIWAVWNPLRNGLAGSRNVLTSKTSSSLYTVQRKTLNFRYQYTWRCLKRKTKISTRNGS